MKILKKIVIPIIVLIIFYFLGRTLYTSWSKIVEASTRIEVGYIILSVLILITAILLGGYNWYFLIKAFGQKMTYWQGVRVMATANFGKYVPGKVWAFGGRVILARKYGVDQIVSTTALMIETICYISVAVVIFIFSLAFDGYVSIPGNVYFIILVIPITIFVLHPRILTFVLKLMAKIVKKKIVPPELKISKLVQIYLLHLFSWTIHSVGFFFLSRAIYPVSFNDIFGIAGSFSISWALSFMVFLIPGGFGIREGLLVFFLKSFMPLPFATLMAFIGRLWTSFGEICYFLISFLKKQ